MFCIRVNKNSSGFHKLVTGIVLLWDVAVVSMVLNRRKKQKEKSERYILERAEQETYLLYKNIF